MKNKLLLGAFLLTGVGGVFAQSALPTIKSGAETTVFKDVQRLGGKNTNNTEKNIGSVVWHDNFDSLSYGSYTAGLVNHEPTNWTVDNAGQTGAAYGWSIDNQWHGWFFIPRMPSVFPSTSGGTFAELANGNVFVAGPPQSVNSVAGVVYTMTSPVIDVESLIEGRGAVLSFEQDGQLFNDKQSVLISTDGGATWTEIYNQATYHGAQEWYVPTSGTELVEIDLDSYISANANSVRIRFQWTTRLTNNPPNGAAWWALGWVVDDIKISTKPDVDVVNTYGHHHSNGAQYTLIPESQVNPIVFRAGVRNQGGNAVTDLKLTISVAGPAGTQSYSSNPITLAPNAVDTLEISFTPTDGIGTYNVTRFLELNETDDVPSNNGTYLTPLRFDVTDNIYAADKQPFGTAFGSINLGWTIEGVTATFDQLGVFYDAFGSQELVSVDFKLNKAQTQLGAEIMAFLYEYNPATQKFDIERAVTDFYEVINLDDLDQIITVDFTAPYTVQAGKQYFLYLDLTLSSAPFAVASAGTGTVNQSAARLLNTSFSGQYLGLDECAVIRARFKPSNVGLENEVVKATEVSIFPNPATDKATINFNTVNASDVSVQVIDITGKVIETVSLNNVAAGVNSTELNIAGFATGIYSVVVTTNDSSVTKKLVIK